MTIRDEAGKATVQEILDKHESHNTMLIEALSSTKYLTHAAADLACLRQELLETYIQQDLDGIELDTSKTTREMVQSIILQYHARLNK